MFAESADSSSGRGRSLLISSTILVSIQTLASVFLVVSQLYPLLQNFITGKCCDFKDRDMDMIVCDISKSKVKCPLAYPLKPQV